MAKRAKLALVAVVALTIAWLAWSYIAHRRLQAKIGELIARHEPVYFSDLDFSPIPNDKNAAFYYQSAATAMSTSAIGPSASNFVFPDHPPYPANWQWMVDNAVAANKQSLALARRARDFDATDWGIRPPKGLIAPYSIGWQLSFNGVRGLAELLADAAQQAHSHGDDAEALQRVFDNLHLADSVEQRRFEVGRLVARGIRAVTVARIEVMATDLRINPNRAEVIHLIHQLLDEKKSREALQDMARYEGVADVNESLALASRATILRPMVDLGTARIFDENAQFRLAVAQTNWPVAEAICTPLPLPSFPQKLRPGPEAPRFSRYADFSFSQRHADLFLLVEFRLLADFRMAAISLAANLYHADHNRWPVDLKSLVPSYLRAVPYDPFYATPHPLGYIVANGSRPLVFCDTDGIPGSSSPPTVPSFGWSNNTGTRQWRDITNWWQKPAVH